MPRPLCPWLSLLGIAAIVACGETVGPNAATLIVDNQTSDKVTVFFTNCDVTTWGGSRGSVGARQERSWQVNPGCWDVRYEWSSSCHFENRGLDLGPNESFRSTLTEPDRDFFCA